MAILNLRFYFPVILTVLWCFPQFVLAQSAQDLEAFTKLDDAKRWGYVLQLNMELFDTTKFHQYYLSFKEIAQKEDDQKALFALELVRFQNRHSIQLPKDQNVPLATELFELANRIDWPEGKLIASHYLQFEKYNQNLLSREQLYSHILTEFEQLQALGVNKMKYFDLSRILHHSARFMYELEDFDKALKILTFAEKFGLANERGLQVWILSINLIASIYQQQKEYEKGIAYTKKLLEQVQNCPSQREGQLRLCKVWEGIAYIDIADMLVKQGKIAEGEAYADKGYKVIKEINDLQSEFDALLALVPTKLELGKLDEANLLLRRMDEILKNPPNPDYIYFKKIRFYEAYASYYEKRGELNAAYRYASLAKPLQDSLNRRNDARKFEKIHQRLEAEKYTEQLRMVESEKQLQKLLRNAALLIILLVGGLAYGNYKRIQFKRQQTLKELEAAKDKLLEFTQHIREKSELAENLRLEIDRLSKSGERSEYLEKLTQSTILTDDDWQQFRSLFEKVYPNFIEEQKNKYPELTQAELRYLVLEKLQLTTHEMANMLAVSDGTIRQTRSRMRKKIGEG